MVDDITSEFERTFIPHLDAAFSLARWITGNPQDAEDVVQEVFREAHQQSNGAEVVSWPALLRRMATCRALDALRRRRVLVPLDGSQPATSKENPQTYPTTS